MLSLHEPLSSTKTKIVALLTGLKNSVFSQINLTWHFTGLCRSLRLWNRLFAWQETEVVWKPHLGTLWHGHQSIFLATRPYEPTLCVLCANLGIQVRTTRGHGNLHVGCTISELWRFAFLDGLLESANVYFDAKDSQWYLATWLQTQ